MLGWWQLKLKGASGQIRHVKTFDSRDIQTSVNNVDMML